MSIAGILRAKGSEVARVAPDADVEAIVQQLTTRRIGAVLVMDGDAILGVVSERDVVRSLAGHQGGVLILMAKDIMTSPVITICPADTVAGAMELMTGRRIRHLPVVESGRLIGLVSIGDLVKARIEEAEREALALKDYIATA